MADNFNTELKQIRKSRGLTQEQLANMVGVSAQAVSKWEISTLPDAALLPQKNQDGSGVDSLPEDWKKMVSFKMKGWNRPVTEFLAEEDPLAVRQQNLFLRGGSL